MADASESVKNEMGLLGSVMVDPERAMPVVMAAGCADVWFAEPRAVAVWQALAKLWDERGAQGIDPLTVLDALRKTDAEKGAAGRAAVDIGFLQGLIDGTPTAAHAEWYAEIVKQQHACRRARRSVRTFEAALENGVGAAIQGLSSELMGLMEYLSRGGCGNDRELVIDRVMAQFEEAHRIVMDEGGGKGRYCPGLPMPWEHMTHLYAGVRPGMNIISGRPSAGKTAFVNNLLHFWCDGLGLAGGLNSLDMKREAMWSRSFSELSRVSLPKATFGMTSKAEMQKLRETASRLKKWPLDMHVCRDLEEFRSWVNLGVMKRKWKFCVVDFIQLLSFRECYKMSVDDRTAHISGVVKALGNDLGIPMIVLSQLNRDCEREGGRPPKPSDLRGGGSLEQDAGTVLMLRRDEKCEEAWKNYPPKHLTPFGSNEQAQAYLAKRLRPVVAALEKNQDGSTGDVPFVFYKNYFMFRLADYLCEPTPVEKNGRVTGWDNTGQFSRVHPDWRQLPEDEALRKSGGLVTEYQDGAD